VESQSNNNDLEKKVGCIGELERGGKIGVEGAIPG